MKKTILIPLLLIATGLLTWYACEKDVPAPPEGQSNKYPYMDTLTIKNITSSSATIETKIINNTSLPIDAKGVCWHTSQNPTISDNYTNDGTGTGNFTSELTGLTEGTTYYVRAYATNSVGTDYGEEKSFLSRTKGTFTDSRDGQTYEWVCIGDQVWMAENLKYLPSVVGPGTGSDTDPYYYVYGYDGTSVSEAKATENYDTYGVLYNWNAVMDGASSSSSNPSGIQGICPDGWHVPSDEEWKELEMQLGMSQSEADNSGDRGTNEGSKLAGNASLWNDGDLTNNSAFGSSGFTALPGGLRDFDGHFGGIGNSLSWWSSTETYSTNARGRGLTYNSSNVARYYGVKEFGYSVRCVRDD